MNSKTLLCMIGLSFLMNSCVGSKSTPPETPESPIQIPLLGATSSDPVRAISYSGYRSGQGPGRADPSYDQVKEDLQIISKRWNMIRVYGSGSHTETILQVISREKIPLHVMLGAWLHAELSNPKCPWGANFTEAQLTQNRAENSVEVDRSIRLARDYPDLVTAISVGNEVLVDWTDHLVPAAQLLAYVKRVKAAVNVAVTIADNYVPWQQGHDELVNQLSFITLHSYPIWENKSIDAALAYAQQNYEVVRNRHPTKPIVIGETGWTTGTNGSQIPVSFANEAFQQQYLQQMTSWSESKGIAVFFFEAFDEDWKGSPDPAEPEKHWGLFTSDRRPKLAMRAHYPELAR